MSLNDILQSTTIQAINKEEVTTLYLYDIYYQPDDFSSSLSYIVGDLVYLESGPQVYRCKLANPAPSTAPPNSTYWEVYADWPLRWTNWSETVVYGGYSYDPAPIRHTEISWNSDGELEPMIMSVGNIGGDRFIQQCIEDYNMIGQTITITQLIKDINDPIICQYTIQGAKAKKGDVSFQLGLGFDCLNIQVPNRTIYRKFCNWKFKQADTCKYAGADATCTKTWEACVAKGNTANFGNFPGVINSYFYF